MEWFYAKLDTTTRKQIEWSICKGVFLGLAFFFIILPILVGVFLGIGAWLMGHWNWNP